MDVLAVDDEALARRTLQHTLGMGGFNVVTAANGREALELLDECPIQLVVTDWEMPVMDGIELCQAIRTSQATRYVYVVLVTSRYRTDDTISALRVGADDYVMKPFDPSELLMRVKTGERIIRTESQAMTIFGLAKLAETRDPETGAHLERVRSYCRILAQQLQRNLKYRDEIDDNYVRLLYETSPLHDIGKVAIPDHILLKPDRLSVEEFETMKTHTLRGAETLQSLREQFPNADFLQMARNIVFFHHEKYDGTGYPNGLVGEEIPLCGRIVAVADVYDALTSKRVYKEAYSHEAAKSIIVDEAGKHFDPAIVEAFLECESEFVRIRELYGNGKQGAFDVNGEGATRIAVSTTSTGVET